MAFRRCKCGKPLSYHASRCWDCQAERKKYLPPPDVIADECRRIQAGWTALERYQRTVMKGRSLHVRAYSVVLARRRYSE